MYYGLIIIKLSIRELGDEDGFLIIHISCLTFGALGGMMRVVEEGLVMFLLFSIETWNKNGCLVLWNSCVALVNVLIWGKDMVCWAWNSGCEGWMTSGLDSTFYKLPQDPMILRTSFHLHNPHAYFRVNHRCLVINKYMYIGIKGLRNVGNMMAVCWKNGHNWCTKDSNEIDGNFMGRTCIFHGLRDFGIKRLMSIIKLRSYGSKEQYKSIYI